MRLLLCCLVLALVFSPLSAAEPTPGPVPASDTEKVGTTSGKFAGIDQGDYFHLLLQTAGDQEESFMIVKADKTVQEFLEHPEEFLGAAITVHWLEKEIDIPEAGGLVLVKQVVKVEKD